MHELKVLGPIDARKWDVDNPEGFPHALSVEEWSLPDATRFIELSFKVSADEANDTQTAFRALLTGLELSVAGDATPKTPRVLNFFADRLASNESGRSCAVSRPTGNRRRRGASAATLELARRSESPQRIFSTN